MAGGKWPEAIRRSAHPPRFSVRWALSVCFAAAGTNPLAL
jgi:hypothetical protein